MKQIFQLRSSVCYLLAGLLLAVAAGAASFNAGQLPFSRPVLARMRQQNRQNHAMLERMITENRELAAGMTELNLMRRTALPAGGDPQQLLREQLEKSSGRAGLQLRALSECRKSNPAEHVELYEISFSAVGSAAELLAFCAALEEEPSGLYWRNLSVRAGADKDMLDAGGAVCLLRFTEDQ